MAEVNGLVLHQLRGLRKYVNSFRISGNPPEIETGSFLLDVIK
jgi:hypothetical protein